jgi:serine/threonine protein kinase
MADEVTPKLPEPGHIVGGKYEVVRPIGKGGMGVVFEAVHVRLQQRVAIKMLFPHARDAPGAIERFEREARAAGQLRSPNVARVLDVETAEGELPFIVMEFLEGNDLDDEIAGAGRLPVEDSVDYILQACCAMREAHHLGIVHRDLKPANLFLCRTADGPLIKVLDFGISKITSEIDGRLTGPLQTMGSPVYMSPEQLRGLRDVDARADLWALGVTLFELIAGRPPYVGTVTSTIAAILSDAPPTPSSLRRGVPVGLDDVVLRALAKKPGERYQDAEGFAEALVPYASADGVKRLRASMAAPLDAPGSRRLTPLSVAATTGDRSAPTALARRDSRHPATNTAQSWSTSPHGLGMAPRRRLLLAVGVGVVAGTIAAAFMLVGRGKTPPAPDPAAASIATADTAAPSGDTPKPPSLPPSGDTPKPLVTPVEPEVVASPEDLPWTAVAPQNASKTDWRLVNPPAPGATADTPAASSHVAPARKPAWTPPRHAPGTTPAPAPANPMHL